MAAAAEIRRLPIKITILRRGANSQQQIADDRWPRAGPGGLSGSTNHESLLTGRFWLAAPPHRGLLCKNLSLRTLVRVRYVYKPTPPTYEPLIHRRRSYRIPK